MDALPTCPVHRISASNSRLDMVAAEHLVHVATSAFQRGARALVIELAGVTSIDAAGVAGLAAIHRRAPAGAQLALAALGVSAQAVVRATCLHEIFEIYATADAALATLTR